MSGGFTNDMVFFFAPDYLYSGGYLFLFFISAVLNTVSSGEKDEADKDSIGSIRVTSGGGRLESIPAGRRSGSSFSTLFPGVGSGKSNSQTSPERGTGETDLG